MMTVTTQGGAVYSLAYRDLGGAGDRLAARREDGGDDPPATNRPMLPERWYQVELLSPLPPEIGSHLAMILDPIEGDLDPVVRYSTVVMSVVGVL